MTEHMKKRAARSPNYPIQPLEWAVNTALELLEKEGLHPAPSDIVARNLGYKDANNGMACRILANLKAFGVIDKASGGKLAINQDVQRYKLTPTKDDKIIYLKQWLNTPLLYRKLIEKYDNDLPSDAVLLFELVDEHGFNEAAATKAIKVFRDSVNFVFGNANSYNSSNYIDATDNDEPEENISQKTTAVHQLKTTDKVPTSYGFSSGQTSPPLQEHIKQENIRYPIRLAGKRMAWIDVPVPFYEADKNKLRAQIEIIGTEDEDNEFGDY